jgi:hypothetical protein
MKISCERFIKSIQDTKWVVENLSMIKKKYRGEFIAVLDQKIVAHNIDIEELMDIVEEKFPGEIEFITTEFIGSKEVKVIL